MKVISFVDLTDPAPSGAIPNYLRELNDVIIAKVHTATSSRCAQELFPVGSVEVNHAIVGVYVAALIYTRLEAPKAENSGEDEPVFCLRFPLVRGKDVGRWFSAAEYLTGCGVLPDDLHDGMPTGRRSKAVSPIIWAMGTSGNAQGAGNLVVLVDAESLSPNIDEEDGCPIGDSVEQGGRKYFLVLHEACTIEQMHGVPSIFGALFYNSTREKFEFAYECGYQYELWTINLM